MSRIAKKIICITILAGILSAPACSHIDETQGLTITDDVLVITSTPSPQHSNEAGNYDDEAKQGSRQTDSDDKNDDSVKVITTEEELEEYFNSITDEEIEELLKILEEIDISDDIDPDADPGFDEIAIPLDE